MEKEDLPCWVRDGAMALQTPLVDEVELISDCPNYKKIASSPPLVRAQFQMAKNVWASHGVEAWDNLPIQSTLLFIANQGRGSGNGIHIDEVAAYNMGLPLTDAMLRRLGIQYAHGWVTDQEDGVLAVRTFIDREHLEAFSKGWLQKMAQATKVDVGAFLPTAMDVEALKKLNLPGVTIIEQRGYDVVYVAAGFAHTVINQQASIKGVFDVMNKEEVVASVQLSNAVGRLRFLGFDAINPNFTAFEVEKHIVKAILAYPKASVCA